MEISVEIFIEKYLNCFLPFNIAKRYIVEIKVFSKPDRVTKMTITIHINNNQKI
jgi:hypothetical protein